MAAEGCTYAVMEVSSHALDQDRVEGCAFDVAVFTNLTQDHLDYHKTMENYLAAKRRLFTLCRTGVVNMDDPWSGKLTEGLDCRLVTYSSGNDEADYTARNIRGRADGVDFELVGTGVIGRVRLGIPGDFSVYNALAAASCALTLGMPFAKVVGRPVWPRRASRAGGNRPHRAGLYRGDRLRPHPGRFGEYLQNHEKMHRGPAGDGFRLRRGPGQGKAAADGGHRRRPIRFYGNHLRQSQDGGARKGLSRISWRG